jgi:epoxyqueuosine reductase
MACLTLAEVLGLGEAEFRMRFAGTPVKRLGYHRLIRNGLIAAGNSGFGHLLPLCQTYLEAADPLVREAAAWAVGRLTEC